MGIAERSLLFLIAFAASGMGCKGKIPDAAPDAKAIATGSLTVGVEAQPAVVSRIGKIHYAAKDGDKALVDTEIVPKTGDTPFPFEIKLAGPSNDNVVVTIEAYAAGPNDTVLATPMLTRRIAAPLVSGDAGAGMLARVRLESSCLIGTPGFKGPVCPEAQSCSNGRCIDPTLLAEDLETYAPEWAKNRPDVCKAAHVTEPASLTVGTGQTDYVNLKDGDTLTPEKGPQGGHHLWISVRQKNLKQIGSTVTISAEQPRTGLKVPPTSFVFPFEPADKGFCKLYGLRLQLDNSSTPVQKFLGKPLDVTVAVRDVEGQAVTSRVHVNVAAKTIGD